MVDEGDGHDTQRIPSTASSMPLCCPSYPRGPYRFIDREYLLIHYESDPETIRDMLPEPLEPDGNHVIFEWMKMLDSQRLRQLPGERHQHRRALERHAVQLQRHDVPRR